MSLAGVQTKLAVAVDETGRVCIPMNGSPSTHILKPDAPRLWGGVQNEAFCLTLARRMKIPTPNVTTGQAGKRTYLLVKRYDRADIGQRPLASLASGRLLPGAREAAIRKVRIQPDGNSWADIEGHV